MVERINARDHRRLVEADTEPMAELQPEARLLVGKSELLRGGPDARDLVGGRTGPDQLDGVVEPLAALRIRIDLGARDPTDVERPVVAGSVAHERMDDVEER